MTFCPSYGIAQPSSKIEKLPWQTVVIDEAQNIKNNDTAQTKTIKTIKQIILLQ